MSSQLDDQFMSAHPSPPPPAQEEADESPAPPIKRSASELADGDLVEVAEPPAKRRATEASGSTGKFAADVMQPTMEQHPSTFQITSEQLRGRAPDDLAELILQMQASYSQQIAALSAQYDTVNKQLIDIKKAISTIFSGHSAAMEAAASYLLPRDAPRSVAPSYHPPVAQTRPPAPAMPISTPSRSSSHRHSPPSPSLRPGAFPQATPSILTDTPMRRDSISLASPSSFHDTPSSQNGMVQKTKIVPNEDGPPTVLYGPANTVEDIWEEYKYGRDGQPSLEQLDSTWGPRWRPEPRGRTWYSRRKLVWDKVKELMHDGLDEKAAVAEVDRLRVGRSMNWLMNILQNNRKETKASWKAAAAAATAAKHAARVGGQATIYNFGGGGSQPVIQGVQVAGAGAMGAGVPAKPSLLQAGPVTRFVMTKDQTQPAEVWRV